MVEQARQRIEELPYIKGLRIFWADLHAMRAWWPVLLPLLTYIGWRTYHDERSRLQQRSHTPGSSIPSVTPPLLPPLPQSSAAAPLPHPTPPPGSRVSLIVHRAADQAEP